MNRTVARPEFEATRRFAVADGKILVRDVALLREIEAVKADRRRSRAYGPGKPLAAARA